MVWVLDFFGFWISALFTNTDLSDQSDFSVSNESDIMLPSPSCLPGYHNAT